MSSTNSREIIKKTSPFNNFVKLESKRVLGDNWKNISFGKKAIIMKQEWDKLSEEEQHMYGYNNHFDIRDFSPVTKDAKLSSQTREIGPNDVIFDFSRKISAELREFLVIECLKRSLSFIEIDHKYFKECVSMIRHVTKDTKSSDNYLVLKYLLNSDIRRTVETWAFSKCHLMSRKLFYVSNIIKKIFPRGLIISDRDIFRVCYSLIENAILEHGIFCNYVVGSINIENKIVFPFDDIVEELDYYVRRNSKHSYDIYSSLVSIAIKKLGRKEAEIHLDELISDKESDYLQGNYHEFDNLEQLEEYREKVASGEIVEDSDEFEEFDDSYGEPEKPRNQV